MALAITNHSHGCRLLLQKSPAKVLFLVLTLKPVWRTGNVSVLVTRYSNSQKTTQKLKTELPPLSYLFFFFGQFWCWMRKSSERHVISSSSAIWSVAFRNRWRKTNSFGFDAVSEKSIIPKMKSWTLFGFGYQAHALAASSSSSLTPHSFWFFYFSFSVLMLQSLGV